MNNLKFYKKEVVAVDTVNIGDVVLVNGSTKTVGKGDVKNDSLFGMTVCGQRKIVTVVLFPKWFKGEIINWTRQI